MATSSVTGTTSVGGLVSGLDTESIISKMMAIEQRPIQLLQQQEAGYKAKISALGALKGVLSDLQTAADALKDPALFGGFSVASGNTSVLTASASSTALAGDYQVTVNGLAQAQQVKSAAFAASDTVVGTGTLTIQVGTGTPVTVTIDSTNNTLAGIAGAINNSGADVTAGVVNDGLGNYYLTLASKITGASNTISLTMADSDGVNTDASGLSSLYATPATQSMSQTQAAANAKVNVNGIDVERSSNTITDLLQGVTLNLKSAAPSAPFDVTVSPNVDSITSGISTFVAKYNAALSALQQLQLSDPSTKTYGVLQGDSTPRILQSGLQGMLFSSVNGVDSAVNNLTSLGVTADKSGKLSFDAAAFTTAYQAHPQDVENFFTQTTEGSQGFAVQLDSFLGTYLTGTTGLLDSKVAGLNTSVADIEDRVATMNDQLAQREDALRQQFNNMETLLAQFQATSGALTQQLQSLSNLNAQIANNSSSTK